MAYVIYGTACEYGIPLDAVLDEVHRSNMSKLGADGRPVYRTDGKVLKGPAFRPPDIAAVLYARRSSDS
jgi:predicted HAD superfamily Cof-like phosphohydrolase